MTTIVDAYDVIRARAETQLAGSTLYWQDVDNVLPDAPVPFIYFEMITDRGFFIEMGGGRGSNRYRHEAELHAYVFSRRGIGLRAMLARAEPVAAVFRRFRSGGVTCRGASVHPVGEGEQLVPPGLSSAAGAYGCVMVAVPLYFDQTN